MTNIHSHWQGLWRIKTNINISIKKIQCKLSSNKQIFILSFIIIIFTIIVLSQIYSKQKKDIPHQFNAESSNNNKDTLQKNLIIHKTNNDNKTKQTDAKLQLEQRKNQAQQQYSYKIKDNIVYIIRILYNMQIFDFKNHIYKIEYLDTLNKVVPSSNLFSANVLQYQLINRFIGNNTLSEILYTKLQQNFLNSLDEQIQNWQLLIKFLFDCEKSKQFIEIWTKKTNGYIDQIASDLNYRLSQLIEIFNNLKTQSKVITINKQ